MFGICINSTRLCLNETFTDIDFKIYPNPVKNELFVNTQTDLNSVEIYDVLGKQILRLDNIENDKPINLSSLKSGIYFAKFNTQAGNYQTKKIIKQ